MFDIFYVNTVLQQQIANNNCKDKVITVVSSYSTNQVGVSFWWKRLLYTVAGKRKFKVGA